MIRTDGFAMLPSPLPVVFLMFTHDQLIQSATVRGLGMSDAITIDSLKSLPVAEKLKLIEDLWDSLEADAPSRLPLPDWHRDQIDRRLEQLDQGISIGEPWADVKSRILRPR
jgi:putative addiction module component (TIGR02574 family)